MPYREFFPAIQLIRFDLLNMRIDGIEMDYRLGTMTNVDIGKKNSVSEAYVRKVAKKYSWVKGESRNIKPPLPEAYKEDMMKPLSETIDAMESEKLTFMLINLAERMLEVLHQVTTYQGELEALILAETADDRDGRRRSAMLKAISLPIRANTLKTISQILTHAKGITSSNAQLVGKKERNAEKAKVAISGKFAPSQPPRLTTFK